MNRSIEKIEGERWMLYIHIPFCERKCGYCDFLSARSDAETKKRYVHKLREEILLLGGKQREKGITKPLRSVFFGGGTPSLLNEEEASLLLDAIRTAFSLAEDTEVTMEFNPGTGKTLPFSSLISMGVNRLSFGVQSFSDEELRLLGRIHTAAEAEKSVLKAHDAGFQNLSIDLMTGIPLQTEKSLISSIEKALTLPLGHISAYSLILEEGTPFFTRYREGKGLPDEDTERAFYTLTRDRLSRAGFLPYEISNYAREGFSCRHNEGYWDLTPYLGAGLGASSFTGRERTRNETSLAEYLEQPSFRYEEVQACTEKSLREEYCFLSLRTTKGIQRERYQSLFGESIEERHGEVLERFQKEGFLTIRGDGYALTDAGISVSNRLMEAFLE